MISLWDHHKAASVFSSGATTVQDACLISSPSCLDPDCYDMLVSIAEAFEDDVVGMVPWWTRELCRARDDLHGFVFIQVDPPLLVGVLWLWGRNS